ncbi:RNA polymerase sigma-70 factor [Crocinitomicaceae bacterium]|nr:RNA polymerase sigma-70 factor [Crocinitomicaceae bacterium]
MTITDYESTFREHYEPLTRYAHSILKNQEEAEDAVQKLFIKFWEKRFELQIDNIRAYLYRATYNTCLNQVKSNKNSLRHVPESEVQVHASDDASDGVLSEELQKQIQDAIEVLPEKCRQVFHLSRFEEKTYKEISEELNISVKTVENHIAKALRIMRTELAEYLPLLLITILVSKGW